MNKRRLAVFDIDGTIFRSSLVIEMFQELVKQELFPKKAAKEVEESYLAWLNRQGQYDVYIWKIVELYLKYIKNCSEDDVSKITRSVVDEQINKVYRFTRDLIHDLKKKNFFLVAISASPDHIVAEFARALNFDLWFGSPFEIKNGKYTGRAESIHLSKKEIVDKLIKERQKHLTIQGSIAVGDTESDIPLLHAVKNPIAFNPNYELAKYAQKKGWRIVTERKDVVYDVLNFSFINPSKSLS